MQPENNALTAIQRKLPGRPFEPGKSGNPGGRPRILANVQEAARQYTAEAMETLANIMRDTKAPPATRVAAANSLLDRGWGRAPASLSLSREDADATSERIVEAFAAAARDAQVLLVNQRQVASEAASRRLDAGQGALEAQMASQAASIENK
jgi:hypothetical protein